ncbi:hypothetical protein [Pedobacter sp. N23S346]
MEFENSGKGRWKKEDGKRKMGNREGENGEWIMRDREKKNPIRGIKF